MLSLPRTRQSDAAAGEYDHGDGPPKLQGTVVVVGTVLPLAPTVVPRPEG